MVTSRSWERKMFVGVQRGFQAVRNVLIFDLDGEYIPVWFKIILHTTCLYFIHVCINFHSLKQKKKFQAGDFFQMPHNFQSLLIPCHPITARQEHCTYGLLPSSENLRLPGVE